MKSEKGVTLISLVVYVMSFLVIAGIVALITNFFFSNSKVLSSGATASSEFDMLNLYLSKEAKQYENWVKVEDDDTSTEEIKKKIFFSNGNEYIFIKEKLDDDEYGKIIFSNDEKYFVLCNYIENLEFPKLDDKSTSEVEKKSEFSDELEITVKILGKEYTQNYIIEK